MSSSEQLFANGRIAVLSNKLLGTDKYMRLAECNTLAEVLKQLNEYGYGTVSDVADYEQVLRGELDKLLCDVKELCCNASALRFLLCKYDFHNAKVLMKGKYLRQDMTEYCFSNVSLSPQQMRDAFNADDYSCVCESMANACDAIDAEFADGNRSPQTVDRLLDKAYFGELRRLANKSMSRLLVKIADLQTNVANLSLITRLKKAHLGDDELKQWLIEGGSVKPKTLIGLYNGEVDVSDAAYRQLSACADSESYFVRMRNKLVADYADPLTLQPALQYFYAKVDETELVRRIIADVKNGVDKEKIKEKINAYAQ